jgi:hypothetical protein
LYLHFWGHLCPIPTFSAACEAVAFVWYFARL